MKILIVDDDYASRRVLAAVLKPYGEPEHASNGKEAVELYKKSLDAGEPYDLMCMDIMMPVMDGQTALQKIREIEKQRKIAPGKEVKVLMATCLDDTKNVCDAFFHGVATAYINKPINKEVVQREIDAMFSSQGQPSL